MKNYYYLDNDRQPKGPCSVEQLEELATTRAITLETMVAAEGDSTWRPVREVLPQKDGGGSRRGIADTLRCAVEAFRKFATDPVGKLHIAGESLDNSSLIGVGVAFALVFVACLFVTALKTSGEPAKALLKLDYLLAAGLPFVCLAVSSFVVRLILRGAGGFGNDCFVAGAALLPLGFAALLSSFLGFANAEVIAVLGVFAVCLMVMILYAGCNRVARMSERAATFAVPTALCISLFVAKVVFASQIEKLMPHFQ